ncbi:hypothetical protein BDV98DRAFT_139520 [Pterulicium gracile]|uniref:DRBM domain-containing protein n=1 Tax=Pterulicium gracile TaxID=1884261 RepID=A0A5C3QXN6_9AGAR|nr:hypothetical protein BDV98DRAFT_139520 [Pterula gracilis]
MANDYTNALNNYLQGRNQLAALSWFDTQTGPVHNPSWTSQCQIYGSVAGTGTGPKKWMARNEAAKVALESLQRNNRP